MPQKMQFFARFYFIARLSDTWKLHLVVTAINTWHMSETIDIQSLDSLHIDACDIIKGEDASHNTTTTE